MPKRMKERDFIDEIKAAGCTLDKGTQHYRSIRYQGLIIAGYAVAHKQGQRDEVKMSYVKEFRKRLHQIKTQLENLQK